MKKIYDDNGNLFAELNYGKKYFLNYSKHSHETFALSIIGSGELEIEFHCKPSANLLPKQIVVFNPNEVHKTKSKLENTFDYYTLHISEEWCKNIQEKTFGLKNGFINLQNLIDEKLIYDELIKIFYDVINNDRENKNYQLEKILENILIKYAIADEFQETNKDEHMIIDEVEKYISNNLFDKQITLEDIALAVGYNESYITRVFKKKFGLTPHAFLINKRIEKARNKLIRSKDINLAQLSNEVGFYDQSHFSKVFKRVFALTPNKYRKN